MKNKYIKDLIDIHTRLINDYNGVEEFEQYEEDRLVIGNVIELLDTTIKYVKFQLSTYPCNDMLENILKLLTGNIEEYELKEMQEYIKNVLNAPLC
jgi:hypothetical protein